MAARRAAIQYRRQYQRDEATASTPEVEVLLARLVAQAYLAEHPHLLMDRQPERDMADMIGEPQP